MTDLLTRLQAASSLRREIGKMIVRKAADQYEKIYGRPALQDQQSTKAEVA